MPTDSASTTVLNEVYVATASPDAALSFKTRLRNLIRGKKEIHKSDKLLGEWHATAIAGNDISSSCLYTAGICAQRGNEKKHFNFDSLL